MIERKEKEKLDNDKKDNDRKKRKSIEERAEVRQG